jgi:hypothetical protein
MTFPYARPVSARAPPRGATELRYGRPHSGMLPSGCARLRSAPQPPPNSRSDDALAGIAKDRRGGLGMLLHDPHDAPSNAASPSCLALSFSCPKIVGPKGQGGLDQSGVRLLAHRPRVLNAFRILARHHRFTVGTVAGR